MEVKGKVCVHYEPSEADGAPTAVLQFKGEDGTVHFTSEPVPLDGPTSFSFGPLATSCELGASFQVGEGDSPEGDPSYAAQAPRPAPAPAPAPGPQRPHRPGRR